MVNEPAQRFNDGLEVTPLWNRRTDRDPFAYT